MEGASEKAGTDDEAVGDEHARPEARETGGVDHFPTPFHAALIATRIGAGTAFHGYVTFASAMRQSADA